jgi:hypothetical protein
MLFAAVSPEVSVMTEYIQWGFAGFAFLLVSVIVWLIGQLLKILAVFAKANERWVEVVTNNTAAIAVLSSGAQEHKSLLIEVKNGLLSRPCLLPEEFRETMGEVIREAKAKLAQEAAT